MIERILMLLALFVVFGGIIGVVAFVAGAAYVQSLYDAAQHKENGGETYEP
jgi:hypothetical protein